MNQIIFYVPETHLEKVKEAMFNAGGGLTFTTATVGSDKVSTFTAGTGTCSFS